MNSQLRSALRGLLIPIRDEDEEIVVTAVSRTLELAGVPIADQDQVIADEFEIWRAGGRDLPHLHETVVVALAASSSPWIKKIALHYFDLHLDLQNRLGMSFEAASGCIGLVDLTADLVSRHRMSASQVALHLQAQGSASDFPWRGYQLVLGKLGIRPELSSSELDTILAGDRESDETIYVDASWGAANEIALRRASTVGLPDETRLDLEALAPEDGSIHWPYLHMLHYSLLPLGRYDHAPSFVYEFSPRGAWAKDTFGSIYAPMTGTAENPILNNAKSVDRLGPWWADSKWRSAGNASRAKAHALTDLLRAIESLPAPAKREFGSVVRAWCLRMVRLFGSEPETLPGPPSERDTVALMESVAAGNTSTRGVLEQRLVDALAAADHRAEKWRSRGLLDSVNAANLPRRKLGDCEFQDAGAKLVVAYEAHGGTLSDAYARGHLVGLRRLITKRIDEEWGSGHGWQVAVKFVAHNFAADSPDSFIVDDVEVGVEFVLFEDFVRNVAVNEVLNEMETYVWSPLNEARTPSSVRAKYREIIAAS